MFPHDGIGKMTVGLLRAFAVTLIAAVAWAQQPAPSQPAGQQPQAPAEAGGPQGDVGPMALPKKKEEPPPEKKPEFKNPAGMPEYSLRVDVPLVQVPVLVTTKDGQFIPGLKKDNFRVWEDGVPQRITNVTQSADLPITAVLLVEFASSFYQFNYDALTASYTFANTLKPNDWIAVVSFDMQPRMLTDFTQDKRAVYAALDTLRIPGLSEIDSWDALYDTLDRLERVQGHKYILWIGTGLDTFSRITYDKILKKVKDSRDITIFAVGTGRIVREYIQTRSLGGGLGARVMSMDFLQAENAMNSICKMTGGRFYFPRFEGELRGIFSDIGESVRNQYTVAYKPSNTRQDGTFRKLKVEVVAPNGGPLIVHNEKGKDVKYQVIARDGYNAKHEVE